MNKNNVEIGFVFSDNAKALIPLVDIRAIMIMPVRLREQPEGILEVRVYFSSTGFIRIHMNKQQLWAFIEAVFDRAYYTCINLQEKKEEGKK